MTAPLDINDFFTKLGLRVSPIPGAYAINKFGDAPNIGSSDDPADVWDGANQTDQFFTYNFLATAKRLQLSSSNASDNITVRVEGLASGGARQTATATVSGQSAVNLGTTASYWDRVNRMSVKGSTDALGDIYAIVSGATLSGGRPVSATGIVSKITQGNNQTLQAIYTVPKDCIAVLYNYSASLRAAAQATVKTADVLFKIRSDGGVFRTQEVFGLTTNGTSSNQHYFQPPVFYDELTDIKVVAQNINANATQVAASFGLGIMPRTAIAALQTDIPRLSA